MIASGPCMQWFVVPTPRRLPGASDDHVGDAVLTRPPAGRAASGTPTRPGAAPWSAWRPTGSPSTRRPHALPSPPRASGARGRGPSPDLADVLVGLRRRGASRAPRARGRGRRGRLAEQRVRLDPRRFDHGFFSSRWTTITSAADELLHPRHPLACHRARVDDELQVEVRDAHAGIALPGGRLADVTPPAAEAEVAPLDGVEDERAVDPLRRRDRERGIALELCKPERRPERGHDRAHEVGQDVLGVVELDAGQVARVPGDVGDQEAGRFDRLHGRSRPIIRMRAPGRITTRWRRRVLPFRRPRRSAPARTPRSPRAGRSGSPPARLSGRHRTNVVPWRNRSPWRWS